MKDTDLIEKNKPIQYSINIASLCTPIVLFAYGLASDSGLIQNPYYLGMGFLLAFGLPWIFIGVMVATIQEKTQQQINTFLIINHIIGAGFIATVTGYSSMVTFLWIVLLMATYIYTKTSYLVASVIILAIIGVIDAFLNNFAPGIVAGNAIVFFSTVMVASVALVLIESVREDKVALRELNDAEQLQRQQTTAVMNNLDGAVCSINSEGIVTLFNASFLDMVDVNGDVNGVDIDTLIELKNTDGEQCLIGDEIRDLTKHTVRDDLVTLIDDEETRIEMTVTPLSDTYASTADSSSSYVIILRDITKSKTLEEERDEFISVVSHELRTPITVAEGTVSNTLAMVNGKKDMPASALHGSIKMAHDQIIFLARMVNDLSTLSRAERGVGDDTEYIDIDELMVFLHKEYQASADEQGLAFHLDVKGKIGGVVTSRLYLGELLQNFITNAIKYTREGSVTLHAKKVKGVITLAVSDTGIGISKHDQEKIYKKFYRSEDYRTRETGGTGLGLYVAQKLARKIGTIIQLKSRINHGSRFSIELPATKEKPEKDKK